MKFIVHIFKLAAASSIMPLFKRYTRYAPVKASDIMSSPPVTAHEDMSIEEVAKLMWDKGVGSILIVNPEMKLVGIVTERDILYASSHMMLSKGVKSIMSKNLVTSKPDDEIASVIDKMRDFNIRHVPVVEEDGRVVGVISTRDVLDFGARLLSLFMR